MTKFSKIMVTVCVFALTLTMMLVPVSATSSGYGRNSPFKAPSYIESFSSNYDTFTYNASGYYPYTTNFAELIDFNSDRSLYVYERSLTVNDEDPSFVVDNYRGINTMILFENYSSSQLYDIINMQFKTNEFVFKYPSSSSNMPAFDIQLSNFEFLGNVHCYANGLYYRDGQVYDLSHEWYKSTFSSTRFVSDDIREGLSLILREGDIVSLSITYTADVEYMDNASEEFVSITSYRGGNIYYDSILAVESVETIDVLSWLPSSVDTFLNTEFLPSISFGVLLMMVLAIPALFAVLKMLGGGG